MVLTELRGIGPGSRGRHIGGIGGQGVECRGERRQVTRRAQRLFEPHNLGRTPEDLQVHLDLDVGRAGVVERPTLLPRQHADEALHADAEGRRRAGRDVTDDAEVVTRAGTIVSDGQPVANSHARRGRESLPAKEVRAGGFEPPRVSPPGPKPGSERPACPSCHAASMIGDLGRPSRSTQRPSARLDRGS